MASDNNRRIAKNTILLYCRQLISLGLSLYTSRLVLQTLGEVDFGIYAAVGGITSLLSVIITSMSASTQRFLSFELGRKNIDGVNDVFTTSNQIHIILSLFVIVLGETIGLWFIYNHLNIDSTRFSVALIIYQISILNCILAIISVPYNALIISNEKMGAFALFSIGDTFLKFIGVILLPLVSIDHLIAYALLMCMVQLLSRVVMWWFCRYQFPNIRYRHSYNIDLFKNMFGIAGWNSLNSIAITCYLQGSVVILNIFFGPIINAAYSVAMQAYSGLRQFCSSFQSASAPQIVKYYAVEEYTELYRLLGFVCKISFFLLFFLTLPFVLTASDVIGFWLVKVPPFAPIFFIWMVIYSYFDIFTYPLDVAAQASGKIARYCSLTSLMTFAIVPIAYIFYKFGCPPETVLFIAVIFAVLGCLLRVSMLTTLIGIDFKFFFKSIIGKSLLSAVICAIIPIMFNLYFPIVPFRFVIIILITLLCCSLGIWKMGLNISERLFVKNIINKMRNKLHL